MAKNLQPDEAHFTIFFVNGTNAVFIAGLEQRKKAQSVLLSPAGKVGRLLLDNDMEIVFRCEFASVVIIKPHGFEQSSVEIPRLLQFSVKETQGEDY